MECAIPREAEINEAEMPSAKPEDIQKCIKAGVLPYCYENTAIEAKLQEQTSIIIIICFILNEECTLTCPMGSILSMFGSLKEYITREVILHIKGDDKK